MVIRARRFAALFVGLGSLGAYVAASGGESALPLEKVVLFTSGVGFFQHAGKVTDDATVEMTFKTEQINDLLKSMVLEDLGGGTVSSVSYASRDPITKTLGTFAVDLTDNPSMGQILGRLRGARIEVEAASPASGTIVGIETRKVAAGDDVTVEKEFITLLTKEGLRTIALDTVTRLKFLDERLQGELEKALAVLALGTDNERKSVTLDFAGKGPRQVRVGYVQEAPLWKTSYRVVLDDAVGGEKNQSLLQGWAIVENTTDQDWKDVRMSLVSGRPISFTMDLYQPLYLPRPEVRQELFASLLPQVYGQDLAKADKAFAAAGGRDGMRKQLADREMRLAAPTSAAAPAANVSVEEQALGMLQGTGSIQSLAQAAPLGELFRYEIAKPVSIGRQRSAMLPIVSARIEAEKVAIYDDRVLAKHPLAGLRLVNTTKLNLMQGPVTVYAGGVYAGDARIEDLPPGGERLVSYAIDLDVEVVPRMEPRPEAIVSVKLSKGTLVVTRKLTRRKVFEIKNSGADPANLLVEHPREEPWKLVKPEKPSETVRDRYRFAVTAEPGKPATLEVVEEQQTHQHLAIANTDDSTILFFTNTKETIPAVKEALGKVIERKRDIERLVQERAKREQEVQVVSQEQERIRQNMAQLERTSDLYTRYVQKFAAQEDRVETLRKEIAELQSGEQESRRALDDYLQTLELD
ncbi:MAG: hypothetical protein K8S94_10070 [Planctomycetia bacterium]|nr:hypothetical protein [Planctomycetia bacterium]